MTNWILALKVLHMLVLLMLSPAEVVSDALPAIFYPFGTEQGDAVAPVNDDGYIGPINITGLGFPFFGNKQHTVYVNTNGGLSFQNEFRTYTPYPFPLLGVPFIAPFWADVDTRLNNGRIYYRESTDAVLLSRASADIRVTFFTSGFYSFTATWIFIATWHNVTFFGGSSTTPVNTFQCVLITDGGNSFAEYNYGKLTWTTGTASGGNSSTGLGGTPAQVGFNAGDATTYYAVPTSRTADVVNIWQQSNVGITGRWVFRVDEAQITLAGCQFTPNCSLDSNTGLCLGTGLCFDDGGPHYKTFDSRRFDYQGVCKHLLSGPLSVPATATLPSFQIFGRNEYRDGLTNISWFRDVEIDYGIEKIQLIRGASLSASDNVVVKRNGVVLKLPYCQPTYAIYNSGSYVRFQAKFGLAVETNGFMVNIYVPDTFRSLLNGLCGNFDGVSTNDLVFNNTDYSANPEQFGDLYIFPDSAVDSPTNCSRTQPSPPLCSPIPKSFVNRCRQLINMTGPFGPCVESMNAAVPGTSNILFRNCLLDACYSNGSVICQNVFSLVEECAFRGFQIDCNLWQTTTKCPVVCTGGMVFECNSSRLCMPTCGNPTVSDECTRPQKGACVCPSGQLLDNGTCTSSCFSGCVDKNFLIHPVGDVWDGTGCFDKLNCSQCTDCLHGHKIIATVNDSVCADGTEFCNNYGQCETLSTTTPMTTTTTAATTTTEQATTTVPKTTATTRWRARRRHCVLQRLLHRLRKLHLKQPQPRVFQRRCLLQLPRAHRLGQLHGELLPIRYILQ